MRAAIIALAVAVAVPRARAGDGAAAERYFRAGEQAYALQSFPAAAEDFEQAYANAPLPAIAFSAAQAYRRAYRVDSKPRYVVRAVALYRAYLDHVKSGGRVRDAADGLDDMERELDRLIRAGVKVTDELAAEHTQLGVDVSLGAADSAAIHEIEEHGTGLRGVAVKLDGKPVAPYALHGVQPGRHVFQIAAPGYQPAERAAVAVQGVASMLEVDLAPLPARLAITTEPGARLSIDGRDAGTAQATALALPAGHHVIAVAERGHHPAVRELELRNGEALRLDLPLARTGERRALPWLAGASVTFAVAAGVTGTFALLAHHDGIAITHRANAAGNLDPDEARAYARDRDRVETLLPVTWIAGGLAVAAAATAAVLYWTDDERPAVPHVAPGITPSGLSATVTGRF